MECIAVLLEVGLPRFEQVLVGNRRFLLPHDEVPVGVRPLQHRATLHHRETRLPQKLQLLRGVRLDVVKQLNFLLDLGQQVLSVLLGLAVVVVPLVVENVALQLVLRCLDLLGLLLEALGGLEFIELVTFVITPAC